MLFPIKARASDDGSSGKHTGCSDDDEREMFSSSVQVGDGNAQSIAQSTSSYLTTLCTDGLSVKRKLFDGDGIVVMGMGTLKEFGDKVGVALTEDLDEESTIL